MTTHDHDPRQILVNSNAEPYCTGCGTVLTRTDPAVRAALRYEQHSIAAQALHNVYGQPRPEGPHAPGFRGGRIPPPPVHSTHNQGAAIADPAFRDPGEQEEDTP